MTLHPIARYTLLAIAGALLLFLAWAGIDGGFHQIDESQGPGQIAQTVFQFAFGLFALLLLVTAFWGARWYRAALWGWVISSTLAGGLAAVVWGGRSIVMGLVSAVGSLLVAWGIAWMLWVGAKRADAGVRS